MTWQHKCCLVCLPEMNLYNFRLFNPRIQRNNININIALKVCQPQVEICVGYFLGNLPFFKSSIQLVRCCDSFTMEVLPYIKCWWDAESCEQGICNRVKMITSTNTKKKGYLAHKGRIGSVGELLLFYNGNLKVSCRNGCGNKISGSSSSFLISMLRPWLGLPLFCNYMCRRALFVE